MTLKNCIRLFATGILVIVSFWAHRSIFAQTRHKSPKTVTIGAVFDLTTTKQVISEAVKAIALAEKELKAQGAPVEIVKFDSKRDAAGTHAAMIKLLKDPPDIIIAETDSSKAFVAAELAEKNKRIMITPFATSPLVTKDKRYVFRTCFSDELQGTVLAHFAYGELKARTVSVLVDTTQLYSVTLAERFSEAFTKMGGKIKKTLKVLGTSTEFSKEIKELKNDPPDLVLIPIYEEAVARILTEAVHHGLTEPTFLGGDGWATANIFDNLIAKKEQPIRAFWALHHRVDLATPSLKTFSKKFQSVYGEPPQVSSSFIAYDTVLLAAKLLQEAKKPISQEQLRKRLHQLKGYSTMTGPIEYLDGQDPIKPVFIHTLKDGKVAFLKEVMP